MEQKLQTIMDALKEFRLSSRLCDKSDSSIYALMHKYDMVFYGSNLNQINSIELNHYLRETTGIDISLDDLNTILPRISIALNMPLEPMKALDDLDNPNPACYFITLWEA